MTDKSNDSNPYSAQNLDVAAEGGAQTAASAATGPGGPLIKLRLGIMMFLEFFIWGAFFVEPAPLFSGTGTELSTPALFAGQNTRPRSLSITRGTTFAPA